MQRELNDTRLKNLVMGLILLGIWKWFYFIAK